MTESTEPPAAGPLAGLRVLELGHYVSAPFCTRLLADLGATVIKVEAPVVGDPMRSNGLQRNGRSLWWSSLARNKQLITLDLRQGEGQEIAARLAADCDVVVENFRPGQLEKWGLGWPALHERNPRLVLVRISGFGQTGPYSDRVAFAPIAEATGGLTFVTGARAEDPAGPSRANISLGDSITGLNAFGMLLAAIYERDVGGTGRGRCVDVSMVESVFAMMDAAVTEFSAVGAVRKPSATTVVFSPSASFKAKDGSWITVTASGDAVFHRLAGAIGRPDLITDARFVSNNDRVRHRVELEAIIAAWAATLPGDEVARRFHATSVPASKVYSMADCVADPHYRARESFVSVDDPVLGTVLHPAVAARFDAPGSQPGIRWPGRDLGADNAAVFGEMLGLAEAELDALRRRGVI